MARTCEHCTFWRGSESSSRADCGHTEIIGTTSFDDTCKHFNAKAWASNPAPDKIDESGKINYWGRGLTFASDGVTPIGVVGDDGRIHLQGVLTIPQRISFCDIDGNYIGHTVGAVRPVDYKIPCESTPGTPAIATGFSDLLDVSSVYTPSYSNTLSNQPTRSITELMSELRNHARRMNMTLIELIEWAEDKGYV